MVTLEMLKGITTGAVRIWEEDGWFRFSRFTRYQEELLQQRGFAPREQAGAGMRLEFLTRGGRLAFDYEVHPGSGRDYWGIEIAHDGLGMVHLQGKVPHSGHVCHQIPPLEREIRVTVYFPNLAALRIRNLQLPEDAAPYTRQKKYLALGDSITQGYDAAHPNQTYVNLLADAWDAQVLNQAIGGDVFCPENLDPALDFSPDIITVAYGTNDWTLQVLQSGAAKAYLDKLTGLYPGVPVFVLLPLWREVENELRGGITLQQGRELLSSWAENRENVFVIDCHHFIPFLPEYFYDGVLHPNDMGYLYYARALEKAVPLFSH
ncbi:MAG: SGNH/GDSL hydrolase family protein [Oscillospiraceae bacterium]|nr:SGNH/GDSL hydrolase family protein [Oscillospiraceae bacterium]